MVSHFICLKFGIDNLIQYVYSVYSHTCLLHWEALRPDFEYPLIHVLYLTLCLNGNRQMISV